MNGIIFFKRTNVLKKVFLFVNKQILVAFITFNCTELFQTVYCHVYTFLRRFVHEVEGGDVDTDGEQLQSDSRERAPLNFWYRHVFHLFEFLSCVNSITLARCFASGSTRPLPGLSLWDFLDPQYVQSCRWMMCPCFDDTGIDHMANSYVWFAY